MSNFATRKAQRIIDAKIGALTREVADGTVKLRKRSISVLHLDHGSNTYAYSYHDAADALASFNSDEEPIGWYDSFPRC